MESNTKRCMDSNTKRRLLGFILLLTYAGSWLLCELPVPAEGQRVAPPPPIPVLPWHYPNDSMVFDLASPRYLDFMIHTLLPAVAMRGRRFWFNHVTVMPEQRTGNGQDRWDPPEAWHIITLENSWDRRGFEERDRANLAIRVDNYYLIGFANKQGQWYAFKNQSHLITDSVELGFGGAYSDLMGDFFNLQLEHLGRWDTQHAMSVLANWDEATGNEDDLKHALAVLVITFCEAARFPRIRERIARAWLTRTKLGWKEVWTFRHWKTYSCAILLYSTYQQWWTEEANLLFSRFGIPNLQQASNQIDLLLQPKRCSVMPINIF